ncbi:bifunctional 4-hydroxy-2-oxoglutarate aldolase/2-dehydro-3-deoxy-phosphogluconate aldolase [Desulfosediminicola sp.]|uniref:bifunctional 4-hydroxy-2-oxoglutarate aldolase/2-dehydro-3-deoxy-phosphogluconate aldolase n=1 Tax=Desulfosediminicola sp. TaxID=2886825 RepID=UPI003AF2BC76
MSSFAEKNSKVIARLTDYRIVPVVSLPSVQAGITLAEILVESGLPVAEVTFRTPCAAEAIAAMKERCSELTIMAGTVLTTEQVDIARQAGAEGIVIPGFERQLVAHCLEQEIPVCPGTATASEVLQCRCMGVNAVKFFPAEVAGGIQMLKALTAVYGDMHFMPTGGVNMDNLLEYLELSSVFCCGGSWLASEELMRQGAWMEIRNRIKRALLAIGSR